MPYRRILLKLSGEALKGEAALKNVAGNIAAAPIHPETLARIAQELAEVVRLGVQVGIVMGGGNWFRGEEGATLAVGRITGDHIGMLATVMNALLLRDALLGVTCEARVLSAIPVEGVVERFERQRALRHLAKQRVVIFAGGTGNPLVSTDSAASLRAIEMGADILLKATFIEGVYSADPTQHPDAVFHPNLSYRQVLEAELGVMDLAAFSQCRDHKMPIRVFNLFRANALRRVVQGEAIGSLVSDA